MAITFKKESRAKEYVVLVLLIILAMVALFFLYQLFIKEAVSEDVSEEFRKPDVKINLSVLLDTKLSNLQLFEDIKPFDGAVGRENPFSSF